MTSEHAIAPADWQPVTPVEATHGQPTQPASDAKPAPKPVDKHAVFQHRLAGIQGRLHDPRTQTDVHTALVDLITALIDEG